MSPIFETTMEILEDGKINLALNDLPYHKGERCLIKFIPDQSYVSNTHIMRNEKGVPFIYGTHLKVVDLVKSHLAYGWSPDELRFQYPQLTMGQIYAALTYYWDHQEMMDREIERGLEDVTKFQKKSGASPLVAKLKSKGLI